MNELKTEATDLNNKLGSPVTNEGKLELNEVVNELKDQYKTEKSTPPGLVLEMKDTTTPTTEASTSTTTEEKPTKETTSTETTPIETADTTSTTSDSQNKDSGVSR